jgi:hypothetical protein
VKFGPCADKYVYPVSTVVALTYVLWPNFVSREVMYLTIWWLGADMARLYLRGKRIDMRNLRRGLAYMLAVICMLTMNAFVRGYTAIGVSPYLELRHFCFALVVVVAAVTWSRLRWIGFRQLFGPFEKIAGISFGIYISYWFLAVNTDYLAFIPNTGCRSVCGIAICVLFAYLIEKIIYPRVNSVVFSRLYRTK